MESATTVNAWIEQLALSILPPRSTKTKQKSQKTIDVFRRRIRHHNFARTNQFDVSDRLDGLEEKFQVLGRDDLSEALYNRRVELREHHQRWIPDVLDLLLRLSHTPEHKTKLTDVSDAIPQTVVPHQLKWSEIDDGDPFDRRDPTWKIPSFSDLSSGEDEDEIETDTTTTSPARDKQHDGRTVHGQEKSPFFSAALDTEEVSRDLRILKNPVNGPAESLTDIQLIRYMLLMLQGYPTSIFRFQHNQVQVNSHVSHPGISAQALQAVVEQLSTVRYNLESVNDWVAQSSSINYIQSIQQMVAATVQDYMASVCTLEERMLHPRSTQVASIPKLVSEIEELAAPLVVLAKYVNDIEDADPIGSLEILHELVSECYFVGNTTGLTTALPIFLRAFEVYAKPIEAWVQRGILDRDTESFFIRSKSDTTSLSNLWHDWFELSTTGPHRAPSFLKEVARDIFACGKTVVFIRSIVKGAKLRPDDDHHNPSLRESMQTLLSDPTIPFPAAFSHIIQNHFSTTLASRTATLRDLLENKCGLTRLLDAFEHIYFHKGSLLPGTIEPRIFTRIDKCMENWNDRFLITDMLEDAFRHTDTPIDLPSLTVHSTHTSSRTMASRRRSVRILSALSIDHVLPWPVANIIPPSSHLTYRRVALHLLQLRRAKFALEHTAHPHVHAVPISTDPRHQRLAQTTTFMLLHVTNTLYDHFTTTVVSVRTAVMRRDLGDARTLDDMIEVHARYIAALDKVCLTSKQMGMLRDTLIGLLDMCIRFADLVVSSSPSNGSESGVTRGREGPEDEVEAGSFVSARSQRRGKRRGRARGKVVGVVDVSSSSDDDDDDDEEEEGGGEGYSSFIVLSEDTSVVQEIQKLQVQFQRQLDFFVAGLRGVGRGTTGGTIEEFEMLADRLDWSGK